MSRGKSPGLFRFKQFSVNHCRSSMRVGVDAVLIGSWSYGDGYTAPKRVLDVGCGCGIISLMMAQRFPEAEITAIDIDADSIDESKSNFENSDWRKRLTTELCDFKDYCEDICLNGEESVQYDLIISNPPYFDDGVNSRNTARLKARHQGTLNPTVLIEDGKKILAPRGRIIMIIPYSQRNKTDRFAEKCGMEIYRSLIVKGNQNVNPKRYIVEYVRSSDFNINEIRREETLTIEIERGEYTEQYIELTQEFYLNF